MKYPPVPLEQTDLLKLIPLMTLTKVAKLALKSGTAPDVLIDAAIIAKYTRQGAHAALREAGYRKRGLRSDKGLTLRRKLDRLVEQANALHARLAQQESSSTGQ
jgi:hypothetical protein